MEKSDASHPFNQLNKEDQRAAIDVAVAAILIGLRIPSTGKPLYDWMATEFTSCRGLPGNVVKYALRSLGLNLLKQDWSLTVEKDGEGITTKFTPKRNDGVNREELQ